MAQSTVLAANTTAATSSDITVAAGSTVTVGLFSSAVAASNLPIGAKFNIRMDTPGDDVVVGTLDNVNRTRLLVGPGTYRVSRVAYSGAAYGVFVET